MWYPPLTREAPGGDGGLRRWPSAALLTAYPLMPAQNTRSCCNTLLKAKVSEPLTPLGKGLYSRQKGVITQGKRGPVTVLDVRSCG